MNEDNKYTHLKRSEELRECKSPCCKNKFKIKKKNKLRRYCSICGSYTSTKLTKLVHENNQKLLRQYGLINFKVIYTGNKGHGIRLKSPTTYFGYNKDKLTKEEIIIALQELQNKIEEDITKLNKTKEIDN